MGEKFEDIDYLRQNIVESEEEEEEDSDTELQIAFQKGLLFKGLNREYEREKKAKINNVAALKERLKEISLGLPWVESLHLTCKPAPLAPEMALKMQMDEDSDKIDKKDEFSREIYFYRLAQSAVLEAVPRLHSLGIKTKRPVDYFAQMSKTDDHMQKVRKRLTVQQNAMELKERARKQRDLKKFGKRVQTEVLLQRQKEKRSMLESVKKYRKGNSNSLDFLEDNYKHNDDEERGSKRINLKKALEEARNKRKFKDSKFGFGGKKRHSKDVTAKDLDGPIHKRGGKSGQGKGQGKGFKLGMGANKKRNMNKKGRNNSRPGKEKRTQKKSRS